ncbi:TetR/AcrR family transcriptional regulator [Kribbella solani]|uniref:AcrR family transcriptional regulator n=1 Tax=Kribbella solani TaxID=236067 RepID=A0A841DSW1_9ACTN|nr:TetR/AcrR family transcriptional regulator [Kribbella solani]MBB5982214.1 AcrR family transcriptional regulator [Kribbella solani]MDX2968193.1 helix-turn-helix domain containing protein [Kribbella solani]MDX3003924.1 helix-turn-helix domain containing protein [Kribbella solani]
MARPRLVSDDVILDATRQVLAELGPVKLTLAAVGARVGLAPPTLMQRFGSKRGLLLASAARSPLMVRYAADQAAARDGSPLANLRYFALSSVAHITRREELGNGLGFVQLDVADPEFRKHALAYAAAIVAACDQFYRAAIEAGELRPDTDVPALARHTLVCFEGTLQVWAVNGWGSLTEFLTEQLDLMIAPYLNQE